MRDKGKGRKVVDIDRHVYRTDDLPSALLQAIVAAEPGERSKARGHLPEPTPEANDGTGPLETKQS